MERREFKSIHEVPIQWPDNVSMHRKHIGLLQNSDVISVTEICHSMDGNSIIKYFVNTYSACIYRLAIRHQPKPNGSFINGQVIRENEDKASLQEEPISGPIMQQKPQSRQIMAATSELTDRMPECP